MINGHFTLISLCLSDFQIFLNIFLFCNKNNINKDF